MTRMTIADEAELKAARIKSARILTFPDGISRHITLTAKQWANCDALIAEGWPQDKLFWVPFDTAAEIVAKGEANDFEEELRACIRTMAKGAWQYRAEHKKRLPGNKA